MHFFCICLPKTHQAIEMGEARLGIREQCISLGQTHLSYYSLLHYVCTKRIRKYIKIADPFVDHCQFTVSLLYHRVMVEGIYVGREVLV